MYLVRKWSVRHSRRLEWFYFKFEWLVLALHPLLQVIGYDRLEKPVALVEKIVKGFMFDCKMCGNCVLSATGMSCPMNCPKQLRNGPCGGVRANGKCEVNPDILCVWTASYIGSPNMRRGDNIMLVQTPVDRSIEGNSSWLREIRRLREAHDAEKRMLTQP